MTSWSAALDERPRLTLTVIFLTWKLLILTIAFLSPGVGYDTSTNILQSWYSGESISQDVPTLATNKLYNLVRWDGIYYTQLALRGHVYEQEWAFGMGLSTITSAITNLVSTNRRHHSPDNYIVIGVILSHISHWISTMTLYSIAKLAPISKPSVHDGRSAFVATLIHILAPAGIFLSAPYSESLFACLNMLGYWWYLISTQSVEDGKIWSLSFKLFAGLLLGCATIIRSNGVLSGLPFLIDAIEQFFNLLSPAVSVGLKPQIMLQLQFTILGGILIAIGAVIPQYIAFQQYCRDVEVPRPWCSTIPPSIFTFVQSHYWNVGFLRYWTLSNLPLFLLASPCLYLLIRSGLQGCRPLIISTRQSDTTAKLFARLALPQLILALLAITNYHIQIITRIASGYPYWCIWLASTRDGHQHLPLFIRIIVLYSLIQAGLYASFLPPA